MLDFKLSRIQSNGKMTNVLARIYEGEKVFVKDEETGKEVEQYQRSKQVAELDITLDGDVPQEKVREYLNEKLGVEAEKAQAEVLSAQVVIKPSGTVATKETTTYAEVLH